MAVRARTRKLKRIERCFGESVSRKNLEIGVSTKLIVTARIRGECTS